MVKLKGFSVGVDLVPIHCLFSLMQLSLTQSDISHIGSMRVEGIVHPTTAEIDLKEEIGKAWGLEKYHGIAHCPVLMDLVFSCLRCHVEMSLCGIKWPHWRGTGNALILH